MLKPKKPRNEKARLAALLRYEVLDSGREEAYDDLVIIAAGICSVPTATVSLIDAERQWFKAKIGFDSTETEREVSFCAHAILDPDHVTVVPDATADVRFRDNPSVTGPDGIRFYAGSPLLSSDGFRLARCAYSTINPSNSTSSRSTPCRRCRARCRGYWNCGASART